MNYQSIIDYLINFADQDNSYIESLKDLGVPNCAHAQLIIETWFTIPAMLRMTIDSESVILLLKNLRTNRE